MSFDSMPRELVELEDRLRGRSGDEAIAGLRDRVMRAVGEELALPGQAASAQQGNGWHWAAIAAGLLIVLNLSMISASREEFSLGPAPGVNQMAAELHTVEVIEAQQEGMFK